jgi:hypothetical protein
MKSKISTPSATATTIVTFGPVVTMVAMMSLSGSEWMHPTLLPWALVAVSLLWCPFLPTSASAIILGEWRDSIDPWVRGTRRFWPVLRGVLEGPARHAVVMNAAAWAVTAVVAGASFFR